MKKLIEYKQRKSVKVEAASEETTRNSIEHGVETALSLRVMISDPVDREGGSITSVEEVVPVLSLGIPPLQKRCQTGGQAVHLLEFPQKQTCRRQGGRGLGSEHTTRARALRIVRTSGRLEASSSPVRARITSLEISLDRLGDDLREDRLPLHLSRLRRPMRVLGGGQGPQQAVPLVSREVPIQLPS